MKMAAAPSALKLTGIDLNLFVAFEAIYAERNLTRAADILSVTQPAVSNALARLRATFGDPLFERRGGAMVPTAVSQSLIGPVRQALARLRSGLDQRTAFDPAISDRVFHIALRVRNRDHLVELTHALRRVRGVFSVERVRGSVFGKIK